MRTSTFSDLKSEERRRFLDEIGGAELHPAFADLRELEQYLLGPAFESGTTYLVLRDGGEFAGSVGVVVREIATKGEAYLTLLRVCAPDVDAALDRLLKEAYATIRRAGGVDGKSLVKIGVGANQDFLRPPLVRAGCRPAYRIVDMGRPLDAGLPAGREVPFQPLTASNLMDFLVVQNSAFLEIPNGAQLTPGEVEEMRQEARSSRFLQVGYIDARPAVVFEVDVRGDTGQIQTIGVAPAFQRQGLGRAALARALQVVAEEGAKNAHLQVVDANRPAVELYRACGFSLDRVISIWYVGPASYPLR